MQHAAEGPTAVGRLPVELGLGEFAGALSDEPGCLIGTPQPRVEIRTRKGQEITRQGHTRTDPPIGRCWYYSVTLPGKPLVDLVEMVQRVVQHARSALRGVYV